VATEQASLQPASAMERDIYHFTNQGLNQLRLSHGGIGNQRRICGKRVIVHYSMGNYTRTAKVLAQLTVTLETRFGGPATEERIWWHDCGLKVQSDRSQA
jgi:hypothetical protein